MGAKKVEKRTKIKPFVKAINYNHIMPTRYSVDFDLKKSVDESTVLQSAQTRSEAKKAVKKIFEEKYKSQTGKSERYATGAQYFFSKLRF